MTTREYKVSVSQRVITIEDITLEVIAESEEQALIKAKEFIGSGHEFREDVHCASIRVNNRHTELITRKQYLAMKLSDSLISDEDVNEHDRDSDVLRFHVHLVPTQEEIDDFVKNF